MPKILIVDTYYPEFLKSWDFNPAATYESELRRLLEFSFGTGDFYSRNLRALGWEAVDVIYNYELLQEAWRREYGTWQPLLEAQMLEYVKDGGVAFFQDLSLIEDRAWDSRAVLAGQLSCPWPGDSIVRQFHILFTSFPHYVPRIEALGVKAVYNPLAFDPIVLDRIAESNGHCCRDGMAESPAERIHDVVFIGGVGAPSHWRRGMETLNAVAEAIPTFKWWGYGAECLPMNTALFRAYQGEAWGLDMYRILLQSKIVLNRHGEVAEGYANNMRMFEATGCGAMLLTENAPNLSDFFEQSECMVYNSADDAINKIYSLIRPQNVTRTFLAKAGQARTLRDHTYAQRMKTVSGVLTEMLQ